jgi:hypothetical protein
MPIWNILHPIGIFFPVLVYVLYQVKSGNPGLKSDSHTTSNLAAILQIKEVFPNSIHIVSATGSDDLGSNPARVSGFIENMAFLIGKLIKYGVSLNYHT